MQLAKLAYLIISVTFLVGCAGSSTAQPTLVGASKGAGIAVYVSDTLANREINYVLLSFCHPDGVGGVRGGILMTTGTLINIILIGFGIVLPLGVVKYLIREKIAQEVMLRNANDRARTEKSNAAMLKLLKLFLYVSPLIVIIIPYVFYKDDQVGLLRSITLTVLLLVTVVLEYVFQKWLYKRLHCEAGL